MVGQQPLPVSTFSVGIVRLAAAGTGSGRTRPAFRQGSFEFLRGLVADVPRDLDHGRDLWLGNTHGTQFVELTQAHVRVLTGNAGRQRDQRND